jgi:hypothetical protein
VPKSTPVSVRLEADTYRGARELARRTSRSLSSVVSELVEEALRMRKHPGIIFSGPPANREPRVEGSGLEVWQVIEVYRACEQNVERARQVLTHFSERQFDAALGYYRSYPEEIDALIAENERPIDEWRRLYPHIGVVES